jgi:hypothetical protein
MPYYPKNKIKTNLITTGGEYYTISDKQDFNAKDPEEDGVGLTTYSGYYYKLYNGKTYTGKFPGDGDNVLLEKALPLESSIPNVVQSSSSVPPLYPTDKDYENGMFTRYFSKKRNEYLFKELTKSEYDALNKTSNIEFTLYKPFFIDWMLVGFQQDILQYNFYSVKSTERKEDVLGLSEYLKNDYLKYSIIKINE